jgi:hypothetical protein
VPVPKISARTRDITLRGYGRERCADEVDVRKVGAIFTAADIG